MAVGCKRLLKSNDWYPAMARDNVAIVTDKIVRMTEDGVITADGKHHRLDAIIFATGFQATRFLTPMKIVGLGEVELSKRWHDGAQAYRGVAVPGFPNFFMMYGPNTNTHNSIVGMLEGQAGYIVKRAKRVVRNKTYEHVKEGPFKKYSDMVQSKVGKYAWSDDCGNWYKEIGGIVTNNWPDYSHRYRLMMMLNDSGNYIAASPAESAEATFAVTTRTQRAPAIAPGITEAREVAPCPGPFKQGRMRTPAQHLSASTSSSSAPASQGFTPFTACAGYGVACVASKPATTSAERGSGIAIPGLVAMSKASTIPTPSQTNSSRTGNGRSALPNQSEILAYLNHVADRFDLRRDIPFETRSDGDALRRDPRRLDRFDQQR